MDGIKLDADSLNMAQQTLKCLLLDAGERRETSDAEAEKLARFVFKAFITLHEQFSAIKTKSD
ncbi:hypothetical protein AXA14_005178 [Escherichia coli]|nr:hypothetical protein [Escherichia coli]